MYQLVRIAQLIGLNAVPGFGFLSLKWTAGTVIALYWIENLIGSLLIALRIDVHRRLTHKRGHYVKHNTGVFVEMDGHKKQLGTIMASFLTTSIVFTLAEGIFLWFMIGQLPDADRVDLHSLRLGVTLVGAFLAAGFLIDLIGIAQRPFFWIHCISDAMVSRVLVLFFVVLIGIWALAFFQASRAFIVVFLVLKTGVDIRAELPESQANAEKEKYGTYQPGDEEVMKVA